MKASELIERLQKEIEFFGRDPYVVIQHPDDDSWNQRDIWCSKRGLMHGYIGDEPVITLDHARTLLGVEMEDQTVNCVEKELDEVKSKLSELLCYVTGGRLSKTDYDIRYMKEVADDYQRDMCVNGCDELEALMSKLEYVERERDAAIKDLTGDCLACKHSSYCSLHPCYCINGNVWEWRVVPNKNKPDT